MKKELVKIHDFVKSLERNELSGEQQALVYAGEDGFYGGATPNRMSCGSTINSSCKNTGDCTQSDNANDCSNTGVCSGSDNATTCTGGGSGASGMFGFPGFGL